LRWCRSCVVTRKRRSHSLATRDQDASILRSIVRHANQCLGLYASVTATGCVGIGDPVSVDRCEVNAAVGSPPNIFRPATAAGVERREDFAGWTGLSSRAFEDGSHRTLCLYGLEPHGEAPELSEMFHDLFGFLDLERAAALLEVTEGE
jgi:hypothetical protein